MRLRRIWAAFRGAAATLQRRLSRTAPSLASSVPRADEASAAGTAQWSLSKPWKPNQEGRRSVEDAVRLAKAWGVVVEDDVRVVASARGDEYLDSLGADVDAGYAGFRSDRSYTWDELLIAGKMVVKLRSTVLDSDEGILEILAHEMHEINSLREMFDQRDRIPGGELILLTEVGRPGNLHDEAWDVGARLLRRFRERAT